MVNLNAKKDGTTMPAMGRRRALHVRCFGHTVRFFAITGACIQVGSADECVLLIRAEKFPVVAFTITCTDLAATVLAAKGVEILLNGQTLGTGRRMLTDSDNIVVGDHEFVFIDLPAKEKDYLDYVKNWAHFLPPIPVTIVVAVAIIAALSLLLTAGGLYDSREEFDFGTVRSRFPDVRLVSRNGQYTVEGFVGTNEDLKEIRNLPLSYRRVMVGSVHSASEIVANARNYFRDSGVIVEYVGHGRLVLSGAAVDQSIAQKIKTFRNASNVDTVVQVTFPPQNPHSPIRRSIIAGQDIPALQSIYFGADGDKYLLSAAGDKYYEGARFSDGTLIAHIEPSGVEFHRADEILLLSIGEDVTKISASRL